MIEPGREMVSGHHRHNVVPYTLRPLPHSVQVLQVLETVDCLSSSFVKLRSGKHHCVDCPKGSPSGGSGGISVLVPLRKRGLHEISAALLEIVPLVLLCLFYLFASSPSVFCLSF